MIKDKYLILVNWENPCRPVKRDALIPVSGVLLESEAAENLKNLLISINAAEKITAVSGWRSVTEQRRIWDDSVKENGMDFTRKYVAAPRHSEHHTGLAVDLALKKDRIDFICPDFPYEGICQEFRQNAPMYGFVERYPENKRHITKIFHEPWHFRYVGRKHALIMTAENLTLEEYLNAL